MDKSLHTMPITGSAWVGLLARVLVPGPRVAPAHLRSARPRGPTGAAGERRLGRIGRIGRAVDVAAAREAADALALGREARTDGALGRLGAAHLDRIRSLDRLPGRWP